MTVLEVMAKQSNELDAFFDRLLANDIRKLTRPGQAMYSVMLNEAVGLDLALTDYQIVIPLNGLTK